MAEIIEFPSNRTKPSYDEVSEHSKQIIFDVFSYLKKNGMVSPGVEFLNDLALLRKFTEAMMLRQIGVENMYVRILDQILDKLAKQ